VVVVDSEGGGVGERNVAEVVGLRRVGGGAGQGCVSTYVLIRIITTDYAV